MEKNIEIEIVSKEYCIKYNGDMADFWLLFVKALTKNRVCITFKNGIPVDEWHWIREIKTAHNQLLVEGEKGLEIEKLTDIAKIEINKGV